MAETDIKSLSNRIELLTDMLSYQAKKTDDNYSEFQNWQKRVETQLGEIKKQLTDSSRSPDKEIEALKSRLKDVEAKVGKMGKK